MFVLTASFFVFSACEEHLEPEQDSNMRTTDTRQVSNYESNKSGDNFMKHIYNLGGATFYVGEYAKFNPYLNGTDIAGLYYIDYGYNSAHGWYYGSNMVHNLTRVSNLSTKDTASFDITNSEFTVYDVNTSQIWSIENVPENDYQTIFANMSNATLAQRAMDSLTAAGAEASYKNGIYNSILAGNGTWTTNSSYINLVSYGAKIGMIHSDYGFKQGPAKLAGDPSKYETLPYIGGVESERADAPSENTRFWGTAYVSVMPTNDYLTPNARGAKAGLDGLHVFSTTQMLAMYACGEIADTLMMSFNSWYDVNVLRYHDGSNQTAMIFLSYPYNTGFPKNTWGITNKQTDYITTQNQFPNGADFVSYVSETSDMSLCFYVSEPMFFGRNTNTTTGLDNVYCGAPKRKTMATNSSITPDEVVISGEYKEYRNNGSSNQGVEISFVYGGKRQKR